MAFCMSSISSLGKSFTNPHCRHCLNAPYISEVILTAPPHLGQDFNFIVLSSGIVFPGFPKSVDQISENNFICLKLRYSNLSILLLFHRIETELSHEFYSMSTGFA